MLRWPTDSKITTAQHRNQIPCICLYCIESCINRPHHPPSWSNAKLQALSFYKAYFPSLKNKWERHYFRPTILHASFPKFPFFFVEASLLQSRPQSFKNFEEVDTWATSRRGVANPRGYTPLGNCYVMGRLVAMKVNKSHQEGLKYGLIYSQHCVTHMASKH